MELTFATAAVRELCSSRERMVKKWGTPGFVAVGRRLQELSAVPSMQAASLLPRALIEARGERVSISFDDEVFITARVIEGDVDVTVLRVSSVEYRNEGA